jgi:cytochrome P450
MNARPPVIDLDHHSPEFAAEADGRWKELRETCPVAWSTSYGGFWVVSDYEGNHEVLKHHEIFTSERWPVDDGRGTSQIPSAGKGEPALPLELDPPAHIAVRQLLNRIMSPNAAQAMRPRIAYWTARHIDDVIESGRCDLAYDIASPVPAHVTLEWLGYPLEHAELASYATHEMLGCPPGSEGFNRGYEATVRTHEILRAAIEAHRSEPRDDVIGYLMQQSLNGEPLDNSTIFNICVVLVGGGVDTTTSLTSSALVHLNRDRELRKRLRDEPELIVAATEEFLRMYPPLSTIARTARQDTELRGCPVEAGDRVLISRHSANYDARQFTDPDQFIPDRFPNRHVSFGLGVHRCVGSHLARLMFQEMITQLLQRMPDYEIDESAIIPYPDRGFAQGWLNLPATFSAGERSRR